MSVRGAADLIGVWERGTDQPPVRRALLLLETGDRMTGLDTEDAIAFSALLPIGDRDQRLLSLRETLFGSAIEAVTRCSRCGQDVEVEVDAGDLMTDRTNPRGTEFGVVIDGYVLTLRPVTSADVLAVSDLAAETAGRALAERCTVASNDASGAPVMVADLPDAVLAGVSNELARLDPHASIEFAMRCPDCGHEWEAPFDVVSFFWAELDSWARRTLADVHTLARSYGWRERDILDLHPQRRRFYLELVRS